MSIQASYRLLLVILFLHILLFYIFQSTAYNVTADIRTGVKKKEINKSLYVFLLVVSAKNSFWLVNLRNTFIRVITTCQSEGTGEGSGCG